MNNVQFPSVSAGEDCAAIHAANQPIIDDAHDPEFEALMKELREEEQTKISEKKAKHVDPIEEAEIVSILLSPSPLVGITWRLSD